MKLSGMALRMSRHMRSVNYAKQLTCCVVACLSIADWNKELSAFGRS